MKHRDACRLAACVLVVVGSCLASHRANSTTSTNVIGGITFAGEPARIALIEARATVTSHVAVAAAFAYFEGAGGYDEVQLRLTATAAFEVGRWTLENRHMVSLSSESVERYRNRLRMIRPGLLGHANLSARAFDELFVDFDRGRLIRNNLALGAGLQLNRALSAELYHVWVDNRGTPNSNYMLALVTWRIE